MINKDIAELPAVIKRKYNRLPKFAFTTDLLSDAEEKKLKLCFISYQNILEGTYMVIGGCGDYYEYLLFPDEMIERLNENVADDTKTFGKYKDFIKILTKLDKICFAKNIQRLFINFN